VPLLQSNTIHLFNTNHTERGDDDEGTKAKQKTEEQKRDIHDEYIRRESPSDTCHLALQLVVAHSLHNV
jgi:hypothetical protein